MTHSFPLPFSWRQQQQQQQNPKKSKGFLKAARISIIFYFNHIFLQPFVQTYFLFIRVLNALIYTHTHTMWFDRQEKKWEKIFFFYSPWIISIHSARGWIILFIALRRRRMSYYLAFALLYTGNHIFSLLLIYFIISLLISNVFFAILVLMHDLFFYLPLTLTCVCMHLRGVAVLNTIQPQTIQKALFCLLFRFTFILQLNFKWHVFEVFKLLFFPSCCCCCVPVCSL